MTRYLLLITGIFTLLGSGCPVSDKITTPVESNGWFSLFDGESLDGWKQNERGATFSVQDGMIVAHGPRCHMFYVGPVNDANFVNFELKADIMTEPGSNSGIYFHTEYQQRGWPEKGYEVQINNSHSDWRRTGGLYNVVDVRETPAKDNEWFTEHIIVQGKRIIVKVNGEITAEHFEPPDQNIPGNPGRKLSSGTIALQGHDPGSTVYFKNIMIKPLP